MNNWNEIIKHWKQYYKSTQQRETRERIQLNALRNTALHFYQNELIIGFEHSRTLTLPHAVNQCETFTH